MAEIKFFDEIIISSIIRQLDLTSPMEHIYFTREILDNIGVARKEFLVKFENDEVETYVYLSDIPYKFEKGLAYYDILYQTTYGRFYAHENSKMNFFTVPTIYKNLAEFKEVYEKRPSKKASEL